MIDPIQNVEYLQKKRFQKVTELSFEFNINSKKQNLFQNIEEPTNHKTFPQISDKTIKSIEKRDITSQDYENDKNYFSLTFDSDLSEMIETYLQINKIWKIRTPLPTKAFKKKFFEVVRNLRMNDNDFAAFTLILDRLNWENKEKDLFEFLYSVGINILKITSEKEFFKTVEKYSDKILMFSKSYLEWFDKRLEEEKINIYEYLTTQTIFIRVRILNEKHKKYCLTKGNLDYNRMVEYIINLGEKKKKQENKKSNIIKKEELTEVKKEIVVNKNQFEDESIKLTNKLNAVDLGLNESNEENKIIINSFSDNSVGELSLINENPYQFYLNNLLEDSSAFNFQDYMGK